MLDHLVLKSTYINANLIDIIYASLLAFVLGVSIAFTYIRSFTGISYSRAFIQALVFAPLLTAVAMQAIGDSMARGLGMMGAFSLLRFRTNIKDARDMMFMFASLAAGLACGVYAYSIAAVAVIFFACAVYCLYRVPFSVVNDYDAILRFQIDNLPHAHNSVDEILRKLSQHFTLVSMREMAQGERLDVSYRLKMRGQATQGQLLEQLGQVESIRDLHIFIQDQAHEV